MTLRKIALFLACLLIVGCGFKDEMRGWNIYMARQAVSEAKKPIDNAYNDAIQIEKAKILAALPAEPTEEEEAEAEEEIAEKLNEIEAQRAQAMEALEDAADRLDLAQRDFPGPKVKKGKEGPQRSKPGAINTQDEYMYNSYSGFVGKRERRREFVDWLIRPFRAAWDLVLLVIRLAPYVLIILVVIYILYKLSKLYLVIARVIKVTVPKDKAKEIGAGTPVGAAYDKNKKKDKILKESTPPPAPKPTPAPPKPAPPAKPATPPVKPKPKPKPKGKVPPSKVRKPLK